MRTFMLLLLTIIAVTASSKHAADKRLLMEIMDNVDQILEQSSTSNLSQFVRDVFPAAGCSEKHLCQAAMIMPNKHLSHTMLKRRLFAYANYSGHHQCNVSASEEHKMVVFLTKIKECCKEQYSKLIRQRRNV
ncbi:interleukin-4 [Garra rufa]|uniref:interleukin-4 n=1 Tax=Garra rufa TaxID=137080 RepID=UPI003CCED91D